MSEPTQFIFSYKEVVESLIRKQGLTSGIWRLYIKFGLDAGNVAGGTGTPQELHPAAIVPVLEVGLQKVDEEDNISVDAAKVSHAHTVAPTTVRRLATKKK